ncbi:stage III sporulation protein AF [Gracilibacillus halophilus]|uniref:stage III sporulation protein AF n=1 Tax=Gracilibacillus halophilus TaxID=470864 RepID=UPI000A079E60|nr:stage III sporulation protein AF [Gracilibacillus halophilus]
MAFFSSWLLQITIFILLAMLVDMLLPSSAMKQYVKLIVGLLLILVILQPILQLFQVDVQQLISRVTTSSEITSSEENLENQLNQKKNEIDEVNRAYVLEEMVVQMKDVVRDDLQEAYQVTIDEIQVTSDEETIEDIQAIDQIDVSLKTAQSSDENAVEEVVIEIGEKKEKSEKTTVSKNEEEITAFLAKQWDVDKDKIVIRWREQEGD